MPNKNDPYGKPGYRNDNRKMNGGDVVHTATNERSHFSCTNSINAGGKGYSPSLEHIKCDMRGLSPSPQKKKHDNFDFLRRDKNDIVKA